MIVVNPGPVGRPPAPLSADYLPFKFYLSVALISRPFERFGRPSLREAPR